MNKKLINRLLRQAEKAKNTGNYIEEINAYQKLYDLYKHELGEKHPDTLNALVSQIVTTTIKYCLTIK